MEGTVTLHSSIQSSAKQVGGGPMGFRGPLGDSIPTASPFSLSAPSVLTSLHHWSSSFGKLPRSDSLTIRKCSKNGLILAFLSPSFEYLERNTNRISTAGIL